MKYSLIYTENTESFHTDCAADFHIHEAMSEVCRDTRRLDIFMSVMSEPLRDCQTIIYRRDIIKDFLENENIFRSLCAVFKRIEGEKAEYFSARSRLNSRLFSKLAPASMFVDCLKIKVFYLQKLFVFIRELHRLTSAGCFFSEGMKKLCGLCAGLAENAAFADIQELLEKLSEMSPESGYEVAVHITESFFLEDFELSLSAQKKAGSVPGRNKREKNSVGEVFVPLGDEDNIISGFALKRTEAMLESVYKELYGLFDGYGRELKFYETALDLCAFLKKRRMPFCFPELAAKGSGVFACEGLYDFFLLANTQNPEIMVKNDFRAAEHAVLIYGGNGSGKTVFLRSLCTARLFAQAGLPVCAKRAEISPENGMFSVLASAEEEFSENGVGRFEGEAVKLAAIADKASSGSVLYFNEIFQTTAYEDAAEGLYQILEYLKNKGAFIFCVTHLDGLIKKCKGNPGCSLLTARENSFVFKNE